MSANATRRSRFVVTIRHTCLNFHQDEGGKLTLLMPVVLLVMILLLAYVGNAGHVVSRKLHVQSAADSVAASSAQWMARGMNSVTATNHLIGEATAFSVLHESFGGPELDAGVKYETSESFATDKVAGMAAKFAPVGTLPAAFPIPPGVTKKDRQFIDDVVRVVAPAANSTRPNQEPKARHAAFAAIYDSRITLKRDLALYLVIKAGGNVLLVVPKPFAFVATPIGLAAHVAADLVLLDIEAEWIILTVVEKGAQVTRAPKSLLETQVIPKLTEHSEDVSGVDLPETQQTRGATRRMGRVREAAGGVIDAVTVSRVADGIRDTREHLEKQLQVETYVHLPPSFLRLPVEPEPGPSLIADSPPEAWGKDEPRDVMDSEELQELGKPIADSKKKIRRKISDEEADQARLSQMSAAVAERLASDSLDPQERHELRREQSDIAAMQSQKSRRIGEFRKKLQEVNQNEQQLNEMVDLLKELPSKSQNLSSNALPKLINYEEERYSQWVRATHPQVDKMRAPMLTFFNDWLGRCEMKKHYVKWSNRYTLVKSWQFRSGYRLRGYEDSTKKKGASPSAKLSSTQPSAEWKKPETFRPLALMILKGTAASNGQITVLHKGYERWTEDSDDGRDDAEEHFVLFGFAERPYSALFAPRIYNGGPKFIQAYAQSMFYNANPQQPGAKGSHSETQPIVGWDTLNWDAEHPVPEWGSQETSAAGKHPWEVFSSEGYDLPKVRVKLNWQAKLVPVSRKELLKATATKSLFSEHHRADTERNRPYLATGSLDITH